MKQITTLSAKSNSKKLGTFLFKTAGIVLLLLCSQKGFSQTTNSIAPVGNVGIGTTTPQSTLQVVGATKLSGPVAIDSAVTIKDSLSVKGIVTVQSKMVVAGKSTFKKDVSAKQNLTVDSNLTVDGNTTIQGDLSLQSPSLGGYTGLLYSQAGHVIPYPTLNPCFLYSPFWKIQGNTGTNPANNFIGTCDNEDLSIHTNGAERIRISAAGNVAMGGTTSTSTLLNLTATNITGISSYTSNANPYGFNIQAVVDGSSADLTKAFAVIDNKQSTPETFVVYGNGKTIIGTQMPQTSNNSNFMLSVNGEIISREIVVENTDWADYVFKPHYHLMPLEQVAQYIAANNHLPDVPTEADIKKDGNNLGDTQVVLLKKVEELTLYVIQQQKQMKDMQAQIDALSKAQTQK